MHADGNAVFLCPLPFPHYVTPSLPPNHHHAMHINSAICSLWPKYCCQSSIQYIYTYTHMYTFIHIYINAQQSEASIQLRLMPCLWCMACEGYGWQQTSSQNINSSQIMPRTCGITLVCFCIHNLRINTTLVCLFWSLSPLVPSTKP